MDPRFSVKPVKDGWEITDKLYPNEKLTLNGDISALVRVTTMLEASNLLENLKRLGY